MKASKAELVKAIKQKCKDDCCCGDLGEVKQCLVKKCPLYPFRMGAKFEDEVEVSEVEKPKRNRKPMSQAHKDKLAAGREAARAAKLAKA